jgi:cytochrome c-type biogenesis protein CcmH/NrfG
LTPEILVSTVETGPGVVSLNVTEVCVLPIWSIGPAAIVFVLQSTSFSSAQEPVAQNESSLEPEFRQLRATLRARPEFSGPDAESQFRLAEELAHRGDMQGAIQTYRAATRAKPDWPDPYRGLGQVLLDHHEYAEAAQAFSTSIQLGREDHQAFYWLGRAYMGTGELSAAAMALERATELKPDDAEALADLGLVRMAKGDPPGAEQALTRSIGLKPDNADAHRLRDRLMKVKNDPELTRQAGQSILKDLFGRE